MTERKKRKKREKKETKVSLKNKNKISIRIDNSKTTKGKGKTIQQQPKMPYQQIVSIPQPYPIYQPQQPSLADVINSISQKNRQEEEIREMRPKKEMTIEQIPQKEELIPEEIPLEELLEGTNLTSKQREKIKNDVEKQVENLRKRENLRQLLREVGADDLEIKDIKDNQSKMEKLLKSYIKNTPEKPILK
jgi:hypothetical protein